MFYGCRPRGATLASPYGRSGLGVMATSFDTDGLSHVRPPRRPDFRLTVLPTRRAEDRVADSLLAQERARLTAELAASRRELEASRVRILEAADAERRRLERDLHDGVQQQLLGLRLKLDIAAETVAQEPASGQEMLAAVGHQIDDVLATLRSLARGIYPAVLAERGLPEAIKSVARLSPVPVTVRSQGLGRYRQELEVAVYFCCLEALQNVAKHAGEGARATVTLSAGRQRGAVSGPRPRRRV